jgi:hypothetical protein
MLYREIIVIYYENQSYEKQKYILQENAVFEC